MSTGNPAPATPPAGTGPAPDGKTLTPTGPDRPWTTQRVVQVVCLLGAVLMLLFSAASAAAALYRASWAPDPVTLDLPAPSDRPDDNSYARQSYHLNTFLIRRLSQSEQRVAALTSGASLAGAALALLAVSLVVGAVRPAPTVGAAPTAVERLVALAPGLVALIGAVVVIVWSIPTTPSQSPDRMPINFPVGGGSVGPILPPVQF